MFITLYDSLLQRRQTDRQADRITIGAERTQPD